IPLSRGSIAGHPLAFTPGAHKKFEQVAFDVFDLFGKPRISVDLSKTSSVFGRSELSHTIAFSLRGVLAMLAINPQRSAMRPQFFDIENRKTGAFEHVLHDQQRQIREVFVINRVELSMANLLHEVRKLERDHTVRLQQDFHACDKGKQIRYMSQNVVPEK